MFVNKHLFSLFPRPYRLEIHGQLVETCSDCLMDAKYVSSRVRQFKKSRILSDEEPKKLRS